MRNSTASSGSPRKGDSHVASAGFKVQSEATNPPFFSRTSNPQDSISEMERCDHVEISVVEGGCSRVAA
jgi:hypothetical protein